MSEEILLSVAIPTYNRAEFLKRAIESVTCQMTSEMELLISDNASQDSTEALVREKMREFPQIRYVKNPENIGPDLNFLQGIRLARGKYVLLLGDDDLLAEGAAERILTFLKENSCALVFLNHGLFRGKYRGIQSCADFSLKKREGYSVTTNKDEFLLACSHRLTYMSSFLLSKEAFETVQEPERYTGTNFIHTCVAFEATKGKEAKLGTVYFPCIAQDSTPGNSGVDKNLSSFFRIFGASFYHVYCEIAPEFGYGLPAAQKVFRLTLNTWWSRIILKLKSVSDKKWKAEYKRYGKPLLKKFKGPYLRCLPVLLLPNFLAKFLHKTLRPIYRKIKHIES